MLRVTWRNLVSRKIRLAMSGLAIVLGVAFVSGSFIFTDALSGAFDGIVKGTTADVEVAPRGSADVNAAADSRSVPSSLVTRLEQLPQAASATGVDKVQGVYVVSKAGRLIGGNGPPGLAFNFTTTRAITGQRILTLQSGRLPEGVHQIALDAATAQKGGYHVGDRVHLATPGPQPSMTATLTGLVRFGSEGGLVGATLTIFDRTAIQQLFFGGRDVFTSVSLTAAPGVSQTGLKEAASRVLPAGVSAQTGDALAQKSEDAIGQALGFVSTFLLVFAAIAMVVGTFLIINTFSILVAQRSRELALLRALGASKRQVTRSVLAEALAVGLVGSTIGIGAGYLLALGLKALFGAVGLDLGGASFPLLPRTVVVSYAVGLVVTLFAAYLPARRASRIAPVAAMRDDVALPEASLRRRLVAGVGEVVVGVAVMMLGFAVNGGTGLLLIGLGMLLILVGVALVSPMVGRPVIRLLGAAYKAAFGAVGTLATENSLRNPRRTAATASALMIGLTLVALMSILGQSAKASTRQAIETAVSSQLIVSNVVGTPFSPAIARQISRLDGVLAVAEFRQAPGEIDGRQAVLAAADPAAISQALHVPITVGSFAALRPGAILVDAGEAQARGYHVGQRLRLRLQADSQTVIVAGLFEAHALPSTYLVTPDTLIKGGVKPADSLLFITQRPGADVGLLRAQINRLLSGNPTVTLKNQQQFVNEQLGVIDRLLAIIYALLGLAVVIAVLGIVNTLALSVIERTREVGLLRAVGLSRRQLRQMVRLESVAIAVLGGVLGVAMGVAFGVALQRALVSDGITVLSIPWPQLLLFVAFSAVVGVLAAVIPARRAARLNVLRAISTE